MKKAMSMSLLFVMMAFMVTDATDPEFKWLTPSEHTITKGRDDDTRVAYISSNDDPLVKKKFFQGQKVVVAGKAWKVKKPAEHDTDITLRKLGDVKNEVTQSIPSDKAFLITIPPFDTAIRSYRPSVRGDYPIRWENGALVKYVYPYTGVHKVFKDGTVLTDPSGEKISTLFYDKASDTGTIWYMNNVRKGAKGKILSYNYHDIPFNKAYMEKEMGISAFVALGPGNDICTVTWGGSTKKFAKDVEFKLHGNEQIYVVKALSKTPPTIRYITKQQFQAGQAQVETMNADFHKVFLQGTATFHGKAAHREYRDVLSAFAEYVDLLEYDYDYELEGEIAREEEAIRELKRERGKINRLKNRYRH